MSKTNEAILDCLREDARMSWQEIGRRVHLSGQAVATRVQQLQDEGRISGFTIAEDGVERHFVTVFMKDTGFTAFEHFLRERRCVAKAYKTTGEGCYGLVVTPQDKADFDQLLTELLRWGTYRVSTAVRCVK